ncbi:MAG TPA: hypothetical protein VGF46_07870 [Gaiellales bacterium]
MRGRPLNPDGNERLTAAVGLVLIVLTAVELVTIVFGLHQFLSLHVFVGLMLIPPVLLKLGSTGWRFTRYYTRSAAYVAKGAPQIVMRLLAPLLVASTLVLFASGVAMGYTHGNALSLARRLHGPSSVAWLILVGLHVLVYLRRALLSTREDVVARAAVRGAWPRTLLLAATIAAGAAVAVALVPAQHRWLHLHGDHHHKDGETALRLGKGDNPTLRRR